MKTRALSPCFLLAALAAGRAGDAPIPPEEAPRHMTLPEGFRVTLFAGEPDVVQPIAFAIDDRGRLWVAECHSYPDWLPEGSEGKDRILILEDADGDGRFDSRKVFFDRVRNLSGLEIGFGGAWVCSTPHLIFIPDQNGDDAPDGPPEVRLDGWALEAKHNVFNGLAWGPDGWLYGLNGILSDSLVGRPGAPAEERTPLNCGVWRYHPTRRFFEAVAWGTTNPWGLDFDDHGQLFITNCVIHHLWHVIPGAHFKRMYGQDLNPHLYQLMDSPADHLHWAGGPWQDSRGGRGRHGEAGGGHAHAGAMIYLGDNWPQRYRNSLFTSNLHGNRINQDFLKREGSGYLARHAPDFLFANDPWFRGLTLAYGPDGGVFLSDWSDSGECHDQEHVDRSNGRIYKIVHREVAPGRVDLARLSDRELVALQLHRNDWQVRHARRLLQERAALGRDMSEVHRLILEVFRTDPDVTRKLRALWALQVTGGLGEEFLLRALEHQEEHIRSWAVRFLCEGKDPSARALARFAHIGREDPSPLVRLHLASALQRIPLEKRWAIAGVLAARTEDGRDRDLPLMVWYGIEPSITADPARGTSFLAQARIPLLRRHPARRLSDLGPRALGLLSKLLVEAEDSSVQLDVLEGMHAALQGRTDVEAPAGWPAAYRKLALSPSAEVAEKALLLAGLFGSPEALARLRSTLTNSSAATPARETALRALVERKDPALPSLLHRLMEEPALRGRTLRGLAAFDDPSTPRVILDRYPSLTHSEKSDALSTLASRLPFALALVQAIEDGRIPARDLSAFIARQLLRLENRELEERLTRAWGSVRAQAKDKAALATQYKKLLTPENLRSADRSSGRAVFEKNCASCHTLFGAGREVGPDLTGSQRSNLDYNLENLLDPSALVGRDYQMTVLHLKDGRLITGIIQREDHHTLTIQTANDTVIVGRTEVRSRSQSPISLMPEGLLEKLTDEEVRDLIAYLASPEQVPLPAAP